MYKLLPTTWQGESKYIQRISDTAFIPMDESNTDYQEYLKWVAAGNTPLPADGE
jgi:hypothetical protein